MLFQYFYPTESGILELQTDETSVKAVLFRDEASQNSEDLPKVMRDLIEELNRYFTGLPSTNKLLLNPDGTDFQKKVWTELCKIPFGKTISYIDLAQKLGDEKVIRAAASANGKNPISILIPCHRVIGKSGKLVGYAGGLPRKKWLLEHENRFANGVLTLF